MQIIDQKGKRLYLTEDEREAFRKAALTADRPIRTFCETLLFTGCRISEALELTPQRVDFSAQTIIFRSLKKRGKTVFRAVPVPPDYLDTLNMVHGIREAQQKTRKEHDQPIWNWSRSTAFRRTKEVMRAADLAEGPHLTPKGLRHSYGVHAITTGVPLNMLQKWLGHAMMETTAIYADAVGEEQQTIAARMWT